MCGLPYSGKTYFAHEIIGQTKCVYVGIDNILKDFGYDWDSEKLPDKKGWEKVFQISYQKSKDILKDDLNVLYDSTNHTKASRDVLRELADSIGANAKVIFINVPVEIVWNRWEKNYKEKNRSVINKKLLEMTISAFEAPTEKENIIFVDNI